MNKEFNKQKLSFVGLAIMTVAFFLISRAGFLWSDDYAMGYGKVFAFQQVISNAKWFYLNWGGGFLGAACQYLFCGLLGNHKIWFDLVNTLWFVLFVFACGNIIGSDKKDRSPKMLCFALLFWFLCPVPRETIFWMVGSTAYLWVTTLSFVFLWVFLRLHSEDSSLWKKVLLFLFSVVSAASIIPCVSICGAFVVYYAMHIKKFRGNAVPLVVGFVIGTLILILAPGNFVRAAAPEMYPYSVKILDLIHHPFQEIVKYKAFWILTLVLLLAIRKDKKTVVTWMSDNVILLYSLGWSVIAFTFVFRPAERALLFTETLSIVLLLKFLFDSKFLSECVFSGNQNDNNKIRTLFRRLVSNRGAYIVAALFAFFVLDSVFAIIETKKQNHHNEQILMDLKEVGGIGGVDCCISSHRMAYAPDYPDWSWEGIAYQIEVDSVHVYPYYCQDKYYRNSPYGENVYVDEEGMLNYEQTGHLNNYGIIFVRIPDDSASNKDCPLLITMNYEKPDKWLKDKAERLLGRESLKERTVVVDRDAADESFLGHEYYFVWMKKENIRGLKSIDVELR